MLYATTLRKLRYFFAHLLTNIYKRPSVGVSITKSPHIQRKFLF